MNIVHMNDVQESSIGAIAWAMLTGDRAKELGLVVGVAVVVDLPRAERASHRTPRASASIRAWPR
jgi:hypothetical protein